MSSIETVKELYDEGNYSSALKLVHKMLKKEPDNLKALEMKASLLYVTSRSPGALRAYKRLLQFYEGDDKVWKHLDALSHITSSYRVLNNYDKAISYCEKSIELCERFLRDDRYQKDCFGDHLTVLLWNLGECQFKSRKYSRAIDTYKKLLKSFYEFGSLEAFAEAFHELACAYCKLNLTAEALSAYSEVIKIRKVLGDSLYTSWSHYYVASIHFAARDYKKSFFHVEECLFLMEKLYLDDADLRSEGDHFYRKARRLHKTLTKNKFLWDK